MYTVMDLTELIRHHLVFATDDLETADVRLAQLMRNIEQMITTPRWHEPIYWMACEECGAWVSSELFDVEGAGKDGCFWCADCSFSWNAT